MENKTLLNKICKSFLPFVMCLIAFASIGLKAENTDTARNKDCGLWARFSYSSNGLETKFSGTSNGHYYFWDFGDNSTGYGENQTHKFLNAGTYAVCMTVWNQNKSCSVKVCTKVTVIKPCSISVDFEFSSDGLSMKAKASASESAQYIWDYGDGSTGSGEYGSHTYKEGGTYTVCVKAYSVNSKCSTSICKKIEIKKPCAMTSDFEFSTDGLGFKAKAKSNVDAEYKWDFGDGESASGEYSSHYYKKPGIYVVCVKAFSKDGRCSTSTCKKVEIRQAKCELKIDATYKIDCSTGKVQFRANSIANSSLNFKWDFGNGTSGTGADPSSSYKPGVYKVCVEAWDKNKNCSGSYCFNITICKCAEDVCDLKPDFKYRIDCSNNAIYFMGASNGGANYAWDFGDGSRADGDFVRHAYNGDGTYEVCMKVWNKEENCFKSICKKVVLDCDTCELAPAFEYKVDCITRTVTFFGKSNGGKTYYWNFGDAHDAEGKEVKHGFKEDGTYLVCLTVKDEAGKCKDQVCKKIEISCSHCNLKPAFSFKVNCQDKIVYFKGESNEGTHYIWSFGDGSTGNGSEIKHVYKEDGTYEVCLKVYDNTKKCVATVCHKVVVDCNPCDLNPEFKYTVSCPDRLLKVFAGNYNSSYLYYWSFGDGSSAQGNESKHIFTHDGEYLVCLTVVDRKGTCKEQVCRKIKIDCDTCELNPEFSYHIDCSTRTISFKGSSSGQGNVYYWSFGDGSTGTGLDPKHTYKEDGTYEVVLTVKNNNGTCKEIFTRKIVINCNDCNVKAAFKYEIQYKTDSNNNKYAMVYFKNQSVNGYYYKWTFGDGTYSTTEHPSTRYSKPGVYKVCLMAIDKAEKCRHTICVEIKISFDNTGVNGLNSGAAMMIYPNPSNGKFILQGGTSGTLDVTVKDLSGKTVYTGTAQDGSELSLVGLDNGTYFIETRDSNMMLYTQKLLIVK